MNKKMLFYNISGAIHSNNISEILFEYFRNMYPCHRPLIKKEEGHARNKKILVLFS